MAVHRVVQAQKSGQSEKLDFFKVPAKLLAAALGGFLLAGSHVAGVQSPLAVSLVAALDLWSGIAAFLGALLGFFVGGRTDSAYAEIAAILFMLAVQAVSRELLRVKTPNGIRVAFAGAVSLGCGVVLALMSGGTGTAYFVAVSRAVLCACGTYFLLSVADGVRQEGGLVLSGRAGACLGALFVLGIASLCPLSIGPFNFGRSAGILVTMLAVMKFRHLGGALCGALTACGVVLYSPQMGGAAMLLPVAGLVGGLFADFGRLPAAFFFIASNAVGLIVLGVTPETSRILVDVTAATVAFALLPEYFGTGFFILPGENAAADTDSLSASQLDFAAKTIGEVRKSVEQISESLEKSVQNADLPTRVCDQVCGSCRNNLACWEKNFDGSFESFSHIAGKLADNGRITSDELPAGLKNCFKRTALTDCFNREFLMEQGERAANRKMSELRGVLFEQLDGMSDMLEEIAGEFTTVHQWDKALSQKVRDFLADFGAEAPRACVSWDAQGHIKIEAYYRGHIRLADSDLSDELSELTGSDLDQPQIFLAKDAVKLCLMERPGLRLETGSVQRPAAEEELSGDTQRHFTDGRGNEYLILSDGMGTGRMAAVDSAMTVSLLTRLLKAGVGFRAAVRLINSSMLAKSTSESFATLDILCLNLFTGRLNIYKLGGAATFVRTAGHVARVESSSPPVGILPAPEPEQRSAVLKAGDWLVMTSDGVPSEAYDSIKEEIAKAETLSPQALADLILEKALSLTVDVKRDDITVFAARVFENHP